jgi:hypothetical protein
MFETACAIPVDRPRGAGFWAGASLLRSLRETGSGQARFGAKRFLNRLARRTAPFALVSLALFSTGCLFQKKQARRFVPPPPPASKTANLKLPPVLDPPEVVVATADAGDGPLAIAFGTTELPPPPAPPAPAARRPTPAKPVATPPAAVEPPATPRIAQIIPPEQSREYNKTLDEMLDRVQRALDGFAKRNLTAEQRERMEQIRDFQTQAKQARVEDLVTAVNLAKHADVLAKDLLDRLP